MEARGEKVTRTGNKREKDQPLEARGGKERGSPLEPPEGTQPCQHLNIRSIKLIRFLTSRTVKRLMCAVLTH